VLAQYHTMCRHHAGLLPLVSKHRDEAADLLQRSGSQRLTATLADAYPGRAE
jgi:hypothetical protein